MNKTVFRIILGGIIIIISSPLLTAQLHVNLVLSPLVPLSISTNAGFGLASAKAGIGYDITRNLAWRIDIGINKFATKDVTSYSGYTYVSSIGLIPITTGPVLYLRKENIRPFISLKGGYFVPIADLVEGAPGFSTGLGFQFPFKNERVRMDISVDYNVMLGGQTKDYVVHHGDISGAITTTNYFNWASYLAVNIGLSIGH